MTTVLSAHHAHTRGVRAVALLEILKGTLALAGIIGLLVLMHRRDVGNFAEDVIFKLHLDPTSKLPWMFIEKAYDLGGRSLWTIVAVGLGYIIVRFIEGYGLWHERIWAEWFAIISGSIYIPLEIYEVIRRHTWFHWSLLLINIGIVLYMCYVRFSEHSEIVHARREHVSSEP